MWKPLTQMVETITSVFVNQVLIRKEGDNPELEALSDFLGAFPAQEPLSFFAEEQETLPQRGWVREKGKKGDGILVDFAFGSSLPSGHPKNDRVRGIGLLHPDRERSPHIVLLHGWITPGHQQSMLVAQELLRHGYSTYILELPFHMRRAVSGYFSGTYLMNADLRVLFRGIRQGVADTRKLLRGLKHQGVPSVGLLGISLGAYTSGIVSALEDDLDKLVMLAPLVEPFFTFLHSPMVSKSHRIFQKAELSIRELEGHLAPLNLYNYRPKLPSERIFLINALFDEVVFPEKVRKLWRTWECPHLLEVPHGHVTLFFSWEPFEAAAAYLGNRRVGQKAVSVASHG